MKLSEAMQLFIRDRQLLYCSPKTIEGYNDVLGRFIRFTGDIELEELKIQIIRNYNAALVERQISKASVGSYLRTIKAFINYLEDNEYLPEGRLAKKIKVPRQPKKVIQLFTPEEVEKIFEAVEAEEEWLIVRNRLIIALMYDSGLRQGEIPKLTFKETDFANKVMLVHGKGDKERLVPFGRVTDELLRDYMKLCPFKESELLIIGRRGEPVTNDSIKKMMHRLSEKTGLVELSCHKLRHNFATNWCIQGYERDGYVDNIKLAVLMGHEDLATTQRYMHAAQSIVSTTHFRSHLDDIIPRTSENSAQKPDSEEKPAN